jgi:hypothetical protein
VNEHGLARLPSLASGPRTLALLQPLKPEPIFGPVLAPLFDRDELWMPPTRPAPQRQGGWYAPLTLIAVASLFLMGEGVLKEIPSLTQIQQQLERILDG